MQEFKAATVQEAVRIGLEKMGLTEEQAEITVLDEGGKLFRKARVAISEKVSDNTQKAEPDHRNEDVQPIEPDGSFGDTQAEAAEKSEPAAPAKKAEEATEKPLSKDGEFVLAFVRGVAEKLDAECRFSVKETSERLTVVVSGPGAGKLIGYRGDVLDAVQYIASVLVNRDRKRYKRVSIDCENYREKREESLIKLAERLAEKAVRTGRKVRLEPMNPAERRVIHSALQKNEDVETVSVGTEPNRYLTIVPKNLRDDEEERADRRGGRREARGGNGRRDSRDRGTRGNGRGSARPAKKSSFLGFGSYLGNTKSSLEREIYEERKREFQKNAYTEPQEAESSSGSEPETRTEGSAEE